MPFSIHPSPASTHSFAFLSFRRQQQQQFCECIAAAASFFLFIIRFKIIAAAPHTQNHDGDDDDEDDDEEEEVVFQEHPHTDCSLTRTLSLFPPLHPMSHLIQEFLHDLLPDSPHLPALTEPNNCFSFFPALSP